MKKLLENMLMRMRDFGKFAIGKEINMETLSSKGTSSSIITKSNISKSKTITKSNRSKSILILENGFVNDHRVTNGLKYKKGFYEKIYKKIDEFNYKILSNYFDNDESLYYKLTDEKRREEKMKEKEESNKEKDSKIEIKNIKIFDLKTNSHGYIL